MPTNAYNNDQHFKVSTEGMVIKTFDKRLIFNVQDKLYNLRLVHRNERFSKEFDKVPKKENL